VAYDKALAALADPTRRSLYERLRRREHAVGELARALGVSQPAVSQHLRVLRKARLVRERRMGTRHYYTAHPEGLAELKRYIETLWDDVLEAYAESSPAEQEDQQ
jgi:DNA-binding transcriptional ArsR family regulator